MKLYHFTCAHAAQHIDAQRVLRPWPQPRLGDRSLVWLTDLDAPNRHDVGLTSYTLRCDRMEYRATVDAETAMRWVNYARVLPRNLRQVARELAIEAGRPMHWYVSEHPVPVLAIERWAVTV